MPEHMHAVWILLLGDVDLPNKRTLIKRGFSARIAKGENRSASSTATTVIPSLTESRNSLHQSVRWDARPLIWSGTARMKQFLLFCVFQYWSG
jgi:hypothetical protein